MTEEAIGTRLRRIRLEAGLSQTHLAMRSGIPKSRLSRYENGHLLPSLPTLARLSAGLGVAEATLLGEIDAELEAFVEALRSRGVRFGSVEEARALGERCADLILEPRPRLAGERRRADPA